MLLCKYTFWPREGVDLRALDDEVQGLLASLSRNGQIWGEEVTGHQSGAIKVCLTVPRSDSLHEKYGSEWVRRAHGRVVALCEKEPAWRVVDDRAGPVREETWQEGSGLYLFTHIFDKTSPACAGSTGEAIPLYLLPISQEVRERLVLWAEAYRAHDALQVDCGSLEIPAYRQLAEIGSELSESGRSLCKSLEEGTGQPTYYYLMRYWGRDSGEENRQCPGCGRAWATPASKEAKGLAWFHFRCELCRLVSHQAVSFESKAKAAIGEWCPGKEAETAGPFLRNEWRPGGRHQGVSPETHGPSDDRAKCLAREI